MENHDSELSTFEDDGTSQLLDDSLSDFEKNDLDDDILDTRSELKFDKELETPEEQEKRSRIEDALKNNSKLKVWKNLAIEKFGLVADDLRRYIWPLLLEVDPNPEEETPSLEELSHHSEYNQVVLDVNRSVNRFPPGIPYTQRLALQDQLTVLILRVIIKYPHLRYYQGYHDVAITFLLVVGEAVGFRIMEKLSTEHLRECMEPTMERTSYRLNYIYSILYKQDRELHDFMDRACVGTMFALPWYLTWFGHSLNHYKDVVRLYDYFLATPPMMPLYVAAALVIHRREEVFAEECDMASIHCLLSQIPDNLDFEEILAKALKYYKDCPPEKLEKNVQERVKKEMDQRKKEEQRRLNRINRNRSRLSNNILPYIFNYRSRYGFLFAATTVLIGVCVYYLKASNTGFFTGYFNT